MKKIFRLVLSALLLVVLSSASLYADSHRKSDSDKKHSDSDKEHSNSDKKDSDSDKEHSDSDKNIAPVANAGTDQNVLKNSKVRLDGSKSSDANSDRLTYSWKITSKPRKSRAKLSKSTSEKPTFKADKTGTYVIRLIVNDRKVDSKPDSVTIKAYSRLPEPTPTPEPTPNPTTNPTPNPTTDPTPTQDPTPNPSTDPNPTPPPTSGEYTLLAWNELGMHCMDGSDFSVFTILPPYNNLNAHLIQKVGTSNKHITTGVTLTYQSYNYNGQVNTISSTKTNFWDYVTSLFPGASNIPDVGLTGNKTPSTTPQAMHYDATNNWFAAEGIPIVNRDDDNTTNYYPMVRVLAKDTTGTILASADVVLPVSDEMDCKKCHASTVASTDAKPNTGWENNPNQDQDFKFNILKLHDDNHPINDTDLAALKNKGYLYQTSLYETAKAGTPILCASCHSSNALGTSSIGNAQPLTVALHGKHTDVIDPSNGLRLNDSANRTACYSCHPGAATECLRGAMGDAKDASGNQTMQCQSCHGTLSDVGNPSRTGWLDEPNCQACHQNGQRHTSAIANGTLRASLDNQFATNPNTPSPGVSMYRYSTGHGDLQCSSCHGSTHAIFPTSHAQDNMQSINVQGHSGTIAECTSCHTSMPSTTTGGPHGMHTVGDSWVKSHQDIAERNSAQCTTCHGADYRGSVLAKTYSARAFRDKNYAKGEAVSCYDCHNKKW